MDPAPARPQQPTSQYPPPPQANEQSDHDFAQTAVAALTSAQPQPIQNLQQPPQQPHDLPNGFQHTPGRPNERKRKAAVPGSRGVANLTPEQLAKKRLNDREAQRAIRERTKGTIDTLERRIRELEGQGPYQELQRALTERDRALAECEELRRRLAAVAGIVGNKDIGQTGLNELAALTAQQSPLPPLSAQAQTPQQQQSAPPQTSGQPEAKQPQQQQHLHPDLRSQHLSSDSSASPSVG